MVKCLVLKRQIWVYTARGGIHYLDRLGLETWEINGVRYLPCRELGKGKTEGTVRVRLPGGDQVEVDMADLYKSSKAA